MDGNSREYWNTKFQGHLDTETEGDWDRTETWKTLLEIIKFEGLVTQNWRLLDVGCGFGDFTRYLAKEAGEKFSFLHGVDISKVAVDYANTHMANQNIELYSTIRPVELLGLSAAYIPKGYDIITANEFIEHIEPLHIVFSTVAQLLHPQGFFLITTPLDGCMGGPPEHVHIFSQATLEEQLKPYFYEIRFYPEVRWFPQDPNLISLCVVARK